LEVCIVKHVLGSVIVATIVDFKVMIRPLKAVNQVHALMKRMLEGMTPAATRKK
jgi:hypothetical protein